MSNRFLQAGHTTELKKEYDEAMQAEQEAEQMPMDIEDENPEV